MKTILIPTDFSAVAINAINYAAEFAISTKANLLLLHVYPIPSMVMEAPFASTTEQFDMEESSNEQMEMIVKDIKKRFDQNLSIDYLSLAGHLAEEISDVLEEQKIDLIIMGTHGINGSVWGDNTTDVLKHINCPVLVIPKEAKFQKIDKIVFAFDYIEIKNESVLNPLLEIASLFDSEIMIFKIEKNHDIPTVTEAAEGVKLDHFLEKTKHTYWFSEKKNIIDAIDEMASEKNAVMIAMVKRHHNFFQRIFRESNTELMSLYTHLPLLILHENKL